MTDIDVTHEYEQLGAAYDAFARLLDRPEADLQRADAEVSGWSPAQHLHHILIANGMMLKGIALILRGGRHVLAEGALNRSGRYVMARGFVRGAGQAPEAVRPPEAPGRDDLLASLGRSRERYDATRALLADIPTAQGSLPHQFLGELDAAQWLRLARQHSDHHLAIIADIMKTVEKD